MKTIHKVKLQLEDYQEVKLPSDAAFLTAQVQHDAISVWYETDTDCQDEYWQMFYIVGTGHEMPKGCPSYLGTVQIADGSLVFHVYAK